MKLDIVAREKKRDSLKKEQLPKKYFNFYVAYSWENFGPYLIGYDEFQIASDIEDMFKEQGRNALVLNEYPFELMYE